MVDFNYTVDFEDDLITVATHLFSGTTILTDAPLDNNGKASSFSPTDLVSSALVSCMLTIIAIHYQKNDLDLKPIKSRVKKIMGANPRRISEVQIEFDFGDNQFTKEDLQQLKRLAHSCPVANSLSKDLVITTNFDSII